MKWLFDLPASVLGVIQGYFALVLLGLSLVALLSSKPDPRGLEVIDELLKISREHTVASPLRGLVIIAGGKLTTYRRMARQAVNETLKLFDQLGEAVTIGRAGTKGRPLPGAAGLEQADLEGVAAIGRRLMADYQLDVDTATHLCGVYGMRAPVLAARIAADRALGERIDRELPYVWAEIEFAATHDLARTVEDVLARRIPLLLVSRDQGLGVCERVAAVLAGQLGWSPAQRAQLVEEYRAEVALSRRWNDAPRTATG